MAPGRFDGGREGRHYSRRPWRSQPGARALARAAGRLQTPPREPIVATASMSWVSGFWRSSIGAKVTMAITGALLIAFVVAHLLGNLQLFLGPQAVADYARFLHEREALLWVARIGLLAVFALHVATG